MEVNKIYNGSALEILKTFPDESVQCCVTSSPYYGLRSYNTEPQIWGGDAECVHEWGEQIHVNKGTVGKNKDTLAGTQTAQLSKDANNKGNFCQKCGAWRGELGLEPTPELFIEHLVLIFREVRRVLKKDGVCWLNLGDSYNGSGAGGGTGDKSPIMKNADKQGKHTPTVKIAGLKPKDLIGIPWMAAFALRADGWWLRQDIIWYKRNPMPESVTDRCTKAHEYIFLLTKSAKYYYDADAIRTPIADASVQRMEQNIENQNGSDRVPGKTNGNMKAVIKGYNHRGPGDKKLSGHCGNYDQFGNLIGNGMANKRSVWDVPTKPCKEAHFAVFPDDLIVPCILAGCMEGGTVLDPFMGSGTTAIVSRKLNRNFVGCELNPKYIAIAEKRISKELGMFC